MTFLAKLDQITDLPGCTITESKNMSVRSAELNVVLTRKNPSSKIFKSNWVRNYRIHVEFTIYWHPETVVVLRAPLTPSLKK